MYGPGPVGSHGCGSDGPRPSNRTVPGCTYWTVWIGPPARLWPGPFPYGRVTAVTYGKVMAITYCRVTAVSSDVDNSETVHPNYLKFGVARPQET